MFEDRLVDPNLPPEVQRQLDEPLSECPYLKNGKRCGAPLKDKSSSRIAGAEKCAEHARMAKLGINI